MELGNWEYEVCIGSDDAKSVAGEKPLFLIVYRNTPNVNVPALVKRFQVPLLAITPMNGVISADSQPSYEQLLNPVVYGFLENPTDKELFIAILQMYWMVLARDAARDGGMLLGGVFLEQ